MVTVRQLARQDAQPNLLVTAGRSCNRPFLAIFLTINPIHSSTPKMAKQKHKLVITDREIALFLRQNRLGIAVNE